MVISVSESGKLKSLLHILKTAGKDAACYGLISRTKSTMAVGLRGFVKNSERFSSTS